MGCRSCPVPSRPGDLGGGGNDESYVKMFGMPHGLLFVAYIVLAYLIKDDLKWNSKTFWAVLAASIIPFGTFYIDKKYLRD